MSLALSLLTFKDGLVSGKRFRLRLFHFRFGLCRHWLGLRSGDLGGFGRRGRPGEDLHQKILGLLTFFFQKLEVVFRGLEIEKSFKKICCCCASFPTSWF